MCCQGQGSQELGDGAHLGLPPRFNVFWVFSLITEHMQICGVCVRTHSVWMVFFVSFSFPSLNDDKQISRMLKEKKKKYSFTCD
jgi:hypothetical protein